MQRTKYLCEVKVNDSHGNPQILEVHEVVERGWIFAVDTTFLEQVDTTINSPYSNSKLDCSNNGETP